MRLSLAPGKALPTCAAAAVAASPLPVGHRPRWRELTLAIGGVAPELRRAACEGAAHEGCVLCAVAAAVTAGPTG